MNDFAAAMAPKSDQINAQDLLGGDMTITITGVKVTPGTEQPVSISLQGFNKVWRPCKTTGRILMAAWGADTSKYAGRSVQLYLDPKVKWGGLEVGGIRIRALSHISEEMRIVLAESKQVRKPVTIKPLAMQETKPQPSSASQYDATAALAQATAIAGKGVAVFRDWYNSDDGKACRETKALTPDAMLTLRSVATAADEAMAADPFGLPPLAADPRTATDPEIEAEIVAELRARDAEMEGRV